MACSCRTGWPPTTAWPPPTPAWIGDAFGGVHDRATLLPAIQQGKVTVATIDDKVRRILRRRSSSAGSTASRPTSAGALFAPEGRKLALEAARGGMVLLKNQGDLLPLDKSKLKSIAVIGPAAYPAIPAGGGSAQVRPFVAVSFLEGWPPSWARARR